MDLSEDGVKEGGDDVALLFGFDEEGIVAVIRCELAEGDLDVGAAESGDNCKRLVCRIEPIGGKTQYEEPRASAVESGRERGVTGCKVEVVHGLRDVEV